MKIINGFTLLVPLFFVSWQTGTSAEPDNTTELAGETVTEQAGDSPKPENSSLKSSGAKGQGKPMEISEKRRCYVFGQCQEYSVNFQKESDADSCHKFCGKNEDCGWWSFEPSQSMCMAFKNCTESGDPDTGACPDCISGERLCPARKCHDPTKCDGHLADSFSTAHLEDCIRSCNDNPSCFFYTFEKSNDHCVLYKDRGACEPCETCASGKKECSVGYHGTNRSAFKSPAKKVRGQCFISLGRWFCD